MTRERIEDFREIVLPFVKKRLLETNYENLGKSDAEEFEKDFNEILDMAIKALEQEPQTFKWCTDCKEYDQEKHCCHRWSKVIRDTVEEMKQEPKTGHWVMPVQDDGMSAPIYYQVRCSECGFDLDPQTWHQELHQYGADKYCPNCGCAMKRE